MVRNNGTQISRIKKRNSVSVNQEQYTIKKDIRLTPAQAANWYPDQVRAFLSRDQPNNIQITNNDPSSSTANDTLLGTMYDIVGMRTGFTREEFDQRFPTRKDFLDSPEWGRIRIFILTRDKYTCQVASCKKQPARQVHHLSDALIYPELCLNPKNLITLCDECHDEWHKRQR